MVKSIAIPYYLSLFGGNFLQRHPDNKLSWQLNNNLTSIRDDKQMVRKNIDFFKPSMHRLHHPLVIAGKGDMFRTLK